MLARAARSAAAAVLGVSAVRAAEPPRPERLLAEAHPGAVVTRASVALTDEQAARVEELAGSRLASRLVLAWTIERDGVRVGTAYLDTHVVRSLPESVLVTVAPDGASTRVDVIAFREPREYRPPPRWLGQFPGRTLEPDLALGRGLAGISGATLTARAVTAAVRRCLAVAAVLAPPAPPSAP
jgi:hypothetical protein